MSNAIHQTMRGFMWFAPPTPKPALQAQGSSADNLRAERDTLREAMREIATTEVNSNSDADVMGAALDNVVALAQGALRACKKLEAA